MIARSQLAVLMCLAAAIPAIAATNPSVPPLKIRIEPIVPRGGARYPRISTSCNWTEET